MSNNEINIYNGCSNMNVDCNGGNGNGNGNGNGIGTTAAAVLPAPLQWDWAKEPDDENTSYSIEDSATDSQNNCYYVGGFIGTLNLPSLAPLNSTGNFDGFIAKVDPSGNFLWAKSYGGSSTDFVEYVTVDSNDNPIIAGKFHGTITFPTTPPTTYTKTVANPDIFWAKLDTNGNMLWVNRSSTYTNQSVFLTGLDIDGNDNIYSVGYFFGYVGYFGTIVKSSTTNVNSYITQLDNTTGVFQYVSLYNAQPGIPFAMVTASSGNTIVSGTISGTISFTTAGAPITITGSNVSYIVKFDSNGLALFAKIVTTSRLNLIVGKDSNENIYLSGDFRGTTSIAGSFITSIGNNDVFVVKLDPVGNHVWSATGGGFNYDYVTRGGRRNSSYTDVLGNTYVTGVFGERNGGTALFGTHTLTAAGGGDIFVAKINTAGTWEWATEAGGSGDSGRFGTTDDFGRTITVSDHGDIFMSGQYEGPTASFGPNITITRQPLKRSRPYIAKILGIPQNTAPECTNTPVFMTNQSQTLVVTAAQGLLQYATDADNDPLVPSVVVQPQFGTLILNPDGSFTYVPNSGYVGNDSFQWRVNDGTEDSQTCLTMIQVNNVVPVITSCVTPLNPTQAGTSINISGSFTDAAGEVNQATVNWNDGSPVEPLAVNQLADTFSGTHTYATAGVYQITVVVSDPHGGQDTKLCDGLIVIYDPSAGFVTGGGWIQSLPGMYLLDPTVQGRANFGFVAKYKKGANVPDGQTQFQFQAGNLNFHSTSYDWLVVAGNGAKAQYKGNGTINGGGDYKFHVTLIDAKNTNSTNVDLFRMKITQVGGGLVYDNQVGATEGTDPTTALQGGNITIHNK